MELGGHRPQEAQALARGIAEALGPTVKFGIILDRDFRCGEELDEIRTGLREGFEFVHLHARKELENYLIVPSAIDRALERERRASGNDARTSDRPGTSERLDEVAEGLRAYVQAQRVQSAIQFHRAKGDRLDTTTIHERTIFKFEAGWANPSTKVELLPGKVALSKLNEALQADEGISLTSNAIVQSLASEEVAPDLRLLLRKLSRFRRTDSRVDAEIG